MLAGTAITGGDYHLSDSDSRWRPYSKTPRNAAIPNAQNKVEAHAWLDGPRAANGRVTGEVRQLFFDMNLKALGKQPRLTQEIKRPSGRDRSAISRPRRCSSPGTSISITS